MVYKARGVWRTLSAARREQLAPFLAKYEEIREWEGRGSAHPAFYLALPFADLTGRFSGQWKIRARSFRYLQSKILPRLEREYGSRFRVLDIGAGNGWLSYRLALLARPAQATHRAASMVLTSLFLAVVAAGIFQTIAHTACCFILKH